MSENVIKSRLQEFRVLGNEKVSVLYDRENLTVHPLQPLMATKLDALLQSLEHVGEGSALWPKLGALTTSLTQQHFEIPQEIEGAKHIHQEHEERQKIFETLRPTRFLPKLAINISNACNLACSYCYANQGVYGTPKQALMTQEDVEATIRRFATHFDYIEHIQFMGGEPSLNPAAIQKTAELLKELVSNGQLKAVARLGMVTNGVKFSPEFLEICRRYGVSLTVSLDGPKDVHDHVRVRTQGGGSYDAIRENIHRAKDAGIRISFEPTFSRRHLECGMHVKDLCQWFFDEFGHRVLHAPPMEDNAYSTVSLGLSSEEKIREYCEATEWGLDNLLQGKYLMHGFTARTLDSFRTRKKSSQLCGAGISQLAVSFKGDVSPCWMYTDEESFYMGNVNKDDFLGAHGIAILDVMRQYDIQMRPECQKCWAQPLCFGCSGAEYLKTKTVNERTNCDFTRALMETFILKGVEVLSQLAEKRVRVTASDPKVMNSV